MTNESVREQAGLQTDAAEIEVLAAGTREQRAPRGMSDEAVGRLRAEASELVAQLAQLTGGKELELLDNSTSVGWGRSGERPVRRAASICDLLAGPALSASRRSRRPCTPSIRMSRRSTAFGSG